MPRKLAGLAAVALVAAACQDIPTATEPGVAPAFARSAGTTAASIAALLDETNAELAAAGASYRAAMAEYITALDSHEAGTTVLAKDVGNKQLTADFVPNDPRRVWGGSGDIITFAIDVTGDAVPFAGGLTGAQTDAAIERGMRSWENLRCSDIDLVRIPTGVDIGFIAASNGLGGSFNVVADIQHAGWRDADFEGGTLGVTFTLIWIDLATGQATDIDGNGRADVAFREIYYDPIDNANLVFRAWADNGTSNIDVESVAVHEVGHGLSQAHFGSVQIKDRGRNGLFLQASPRAVMNALYAGPFRTLTGSDNGGHCSNWSSWPNS